MAATGRHVVWRRALSVLVVFSGVGGSVAPVAAAPPAEQDGPEVADWWDDLLAAGEDPGEDYTSPPVEPAESASAIESTPLDTSSAAATLPGPEAAEVTLADRGVAGRAGDTPVRLSAASRASVGETVRVEVLDQAVSERAGVRGFAFRLRGEGGSALTASDDEAAPATLSVDYSSFAHLYGANYAGRLQVRALPECAFADPVPDGCDRVGERLPTRNQHAAQRLVVDIADLGAVQGAPSTARAAGPAGSGMVLAVLAGAEDETGSFKATPLSISGDWEVGIGSGEFSWNYEMPVREAPAGPTPNVGLSYSSGAIDGLVTSRNAQAGRNGLGWSDFASSFIERRYSSCLDDGETTYADLCWASDNATISLNGQSSELVPADPPANTSWVLKDDPRWRVDRLTGASNGDDNGEHWRVTTPDGTQYWFGLGDNPDWTPYPTDSVSTVPVVGNDTGEPCNSEPLNWCTNQAYRWNLDRVVDTNGNTQTWEYEPETNHYLSARSNSDQPYVKGSRLQRVLYGTRAGSAADAQARVEFIGAYRCSTLADDEDPTPCPGPGGSSTAADFPDVPIDLLCNSACTETSPTFFSIWRYARVELYVRTPGWTLVNTVRLTHEYQDPDNNPSTIDDAKLWLSGIQRTGHHPVEGETPATLTLPPTTFEPVTLDNQFDPPVGESAMPHWRIGQVTDEFGRQVDVTYGTPHPCPPPLDTTTGDYKWHLNEQDCLGVLWGPEGQAPTYRTFNKYLVTDVEVVDTTGGSPSMVTSYDYGDQVAPGLPNAAWHWDEDDFVPQSNQLWSDWRGYQDVLVTQGATRTRYRLFRGMNRDIMKMFDPDGYRDATVSSLDGTVVDAPDEPWLAGRVLDEVSLRADGTVERGTVHGYLEVTRVDGPDGPSPSPGDVLNDAFWVGENDMVTRHRTPAAGTVFRRQRTQTTYNALLLFPERVIEHGWTDESGDERCTKTGNVINSGAYMLDYPSSVTRYADTTCTGTEVTRNEIAYDGGAVGTGPAYPGGNPTTTRTKITASPVTWATTTTTYDALGRPLVVTDPNGHTTTTTYSEATGGYPGQIDVTNHVGHTQQTKLLPAWGNPYETVDANGNTTTYDYDPLGRVTSVWQPTELTSGPASWVFNYDIAAGRDEPPVIRTQQLQDTAGSGGSARYLDTWVLYDSLLRERQTHVPSPASGKVIVSDTAYDERGLVQEISVPEAVTATAGDGLVGLPTDGWRNRTQTVYDHMGRVVWELFWADDDDADQIANNAQRFTVTTYTHDTVEVDPLVGGDTRTVTDGLGRNVEVAEHDGTAYRATAYGYDMADRLLSVTDPADNTIAYTYDMAGRRVAMDDPDAGDWTYGYDAAGNQTSVTDALSDVVYTNYDELNRPVERRADDPATGDVLATWDYDAAGELGLPDKSTRTTTAGDWVVDVAGYDARNRPTGRSWTIPAGITGLSGASPETFGPVTYGYDQADHPTSMGYPAVGSLAAETVTTSYDDLGLPDTMTGADDYVSITAYDDRARPGLFGFGPSSALAMGKTWAYDYNQQLEGMGASATGGGLTQSRTITYDQAGNVTERDTTLAGASFRECFGYDARHRLATAYTTTSATTCASGSNKGQGANPYNHTYSYTVDGNLASRTEDATLIDYTYPAGGPSSTRPHAPTEVGANDYTWDANGNQATRTIAGQTETLEWDEEHRLSMVDDPDGDSSFVYDADGARLLRETPDGTTLYIEGHEITAPAGGGAATAVRSYGFGGQPVATRTPTGVDYLVTDNQGSVEQTIPAGSTTAEHTRTYDPYGKLRSGGQPDTDHAWIGQIEDDATGLNYLNARYYDPNTATFTAPDPLYNTAQPKSLNPYTYAWANPVTGADPSGLANIVDNAGVPVTCVSCDDPPAPSNNYLEGVEVQESGAPLTLDEGGTVYLSPANAYFVWLFGRTDELDYRGFDFENDPCNGRFADSACEWAVAALLEGGSFDDAREAYDGYLSLRCQLANCGDVKSLLEQTLEILDALDAAAAIGGVGGARPSARRLGRNLESAGYVRPPEAAAHHIVAGEAPAAAPARSVLRRFNVDINAADNGAFLPRNQSSFNPNGAAVHSSLHSQRYYEAVNDALLSATNRSEVLETLGALRQSLLSGGL